MGFGKVRDSRRTIFGSAPEAVPASARPARNKPSPNGRRIDWTFMACVLPCSMVGIPCWPCREFIADCGATRSVGGVCVGVSALSSVVVRLPEPARDTLAPPHAGPDARHDRREHSRAPQHQPSSTRRSEACVGGGVHELVDDRRCVPDVARARREDLLQVASAEHRPDLLPGFGCAQISKHLLQRFGIAQVDRAQIETRQVGQLIDLCCALNRSAKSRTMIAVCIDVGPSPPCFNPIAMIPPVTAPHTLPRYIPPPKPADTFTAVW